MQTKVNGALEQVENNFFNYFLHWLLTGVSINFVGESLHFESSCCTF